MPAPTFPALAAHLCLRPARLRPVVRTAASTARPDHRIHARRLCPSSTRAGSEAHAADGESSPGHRTLLLSLPYRTRNSRRQNAFPAPLYQALPTRLRPAPPRHRSGPAPQRRSPRHRAPYDRKGRQRGQAMTAAGLRSLFRHHRVLSQVRHANPHRARHTFGTDMVRAGMSLPALQRLMGHSQITTTIKYVNLAPEDIWNEYALAIEKRKKLGSELRS